MRRPFAEARGFLRDHIELPGLTWRMLDFAEADGEPIGDFPGTIDLFSDGSLVALPTPGHTPGSISLLARGGAAASPLLMVGDLTYSTRLMEEGKYPGVGQPGPLKQTS